ncbi:MAG: hypothetical protein ACM3ZC_04710 [Bacteroidota bacterium]
MSDSVLKVIPMESKFMPTQEAQDRAEEFFSSLFPEADEISIDISEEVIFVDQGENLERVLCPACGATLEMDWWVEVMNVAAEGKFSILDVQLPCCGLKTTLNDLRYEWPAGFARFVMEARNPGACELDDQSKQQLESILGCKLRIVNALY